MRIWSLHPKYLDSKGLVALWREGNMARNVLEGKTKGYKHHPQLDRFKRAEKPVECINQYLSAVYRESVERGYNFNGNKINWSFKTTTLPVTSGQMEYESVHLMKKLKKRDIKKFSILSGEKEFDPNPLFNVVEGDIEDWETRENE